MSEKVIKTEEPTSKIMLSEDEFIDENLKRLCANNGGKIEFVSRENGYVDKYKLDDLIELFHRYDLADIKATKSTLTSFGEKVCKDGGWIKYWQIKRQVETLKHFNQTEKENLEIELAKSNIEANKLNDKIAKQNDKDRQANKIAMWINIAIGIINIGLITLQLLKSE
jgi:hypothetical protein